FTPAANGNGNGYASFTFQVQDDGGTANGGQDTDQSANTFTFNVTPVNDAPDVTAPASYTGSPGNPITINGISFTDIDDGGGAEVATFAVTTGALAAVSGGGVTVGGTPIALTLTGTLTDLTNFISAGHLTFTGTQNDTLDVTLDDQGHTGGPPALT